MLKEIKIGKTLVSSKEDVLKLKGKIMKALKGVDRAEYLIVDISGVDFCITRESLQLIQYVFDPERKKRVFLKGSQKNAREIEGVLNELQRGALWIDEQGTLTILGDMVKKNPYKRGCDYLSLLKFIYTERFVTSKDVVEKFNISQSLAFYKLNKLFIWTLVHREKTMVTSGGFTFIYYLPEFIGSNYRWGHWLTEKAVLEK